MRKVINRKELEILDNNDIKITVAKSFNNYYNVYTNYKNENLIKKSENKKTEK